MPHDRPSIFSSLFSKRMLPVYVGGLLIFGVVGYIFFHQSSPGELSRPHTAVAGGAVIFSCKKCHASKGLTAGCLSCHVEIQQQLNQHQGYHDFLAKAKKTECSKCHSEHNGPDYALINPVSWEGKDFKTFTHPHVVFKLVDAHAKLACEKCHAMKDLPPFYLPKFKKYRRELTYLGLKQNCVSCHADPHEGGKIVNCTGCHDQKHWKPAPLFNHDKFYPLRGAHAIISCNKCHAPSNRTRANPSTKWSVAFGATKGKHCIDCHTNPHHAKWLVSCEACHKALDTKWADADHRVTKLLHAQTVFKLVIPHDKVKCDQCHAPSQPFKLKYPNPRSPSYSRALKDCQGCHKDEHRGQFVDKYPRCTLCHTMVGWKPNNFNSQMHAKSAYPLIGGHQLAQCNKCHIKERGTTFRRYINTPRTCAVCHKDVHFGQFRKPDGTTQCEKCHQSTVKWSNLVFNHNTMSRFKLDDAHKNVACKDCHPLVSLPSGVRLVQYKPIKSLCSDCHDFANQ